MTLLYFTTFLKVFQLFPHMTNFSIFLNFSKLYDFLYIFTTFLKLSNFFNTTFSAKFFDCRNTFPIKISFFYKSPVSGCLLSRRLSILHLYSWSGEFDSTARPHFICFHFFQHVQSFQINVNSIWFQKRKNLKNTNFFYVSIEFTRNLLFFFSWE